MVVTTPPLAGAAGFKQRLEELQAQLRASLEREQRLLARGRALGEEALLRARTLEAAAAASATDRAAILGLQRALVGAEELAERSRCRCARLETEAEAARDASASAASEVARLAEAADALRAEAAEARHSAARAQMQLQERARAQASKHAPGSCEGCGTGHEPAAEAPSPFLRWLDSPSGAAATASAAGAAQVQCGAAAPRHALSASAIHALGHSAPEDAVVTVKLQGEPWAAGPPGARPNQLRRALVVLEPLSARPAAARPERTPGVLPSERALAAARPPKAVARVPHEFWGGLLGSATGAAGGAAASSAPPTRWDGEVAQQHALLGRALARIEGRAAAAAATATGARAQRLS